MAAQTFTRPTRVTALTFAFGLVAAGAMLTSIPAFAATETPVIESTSAETAAPESDATGGAPDTADTATQSPSTPDAAGTDSAAPTTSVESTPTMTLDVTTFTIDEVKNGIPFTVTGFEPGTELSLSLGPQRSEAYPVPGPAPITDENGSYTGVAMLPEGWVDLAPEHLVGGFSLLARPAGADVTTMIAQADFVIVPGEGQFTAELLNGSGGEVTQAQAEESGVMYEVGGFRPGASLEVSATDATGAAVEFDSNERLVADDHGFARGTLSASSWPLGSYSITVTDPETADAVTLEFAIVESPSVDDPTPTETATATETGAATPTDSTTTGNELATTGAEGFGPSGLVLAIALVGAGATAAIVSRRFTMD